MKAWSVQEPQTISSLRLQEQDIPAVGENLLLVKVRAAALNYSDILMIQGNYQVRPPLPFTPGQELAGVVVEANEKSKFIVGQAICSKVDWGAFAEYALVREDMAITIPEQIGFEVASALPVVYTTAMVALTETANLQPGKTVLVHAAAGGVGIATVQIAKALGAIVIATASSEQKCELAKRQGADHAFNYRDAAWYEKVKDVTGGCGVDIVLDSVGGEVCLQSLRCLAWEGELLIVGFSSGEIPQIPANRLLLKRASARGVYWSHDKDQVMLQRVSDRLFDLLQQGKIKPVVNANYELADLPEALKDLAERKSVGKLVLSFDY